MSIERTDRENLSNMVDAILFEMKRLGDALVLTQNCLVRNNPNAMLLVRAINDIRDSSVVLLHDSRVAVDIMESALKKPPMTEPKETSKICQTGNP